MVEKEEKNVLKLLLYGSYYGQEQRSRLRHFINPVNSCFWVNHSYKSHPEVLKSHVLANPMQSWCAFSLYHNLTEMKPTSLTALMCCLGIGCLLQSRKVLWCLPRLQQKILIYQSSGVTFLSALVLKMFSVCMLFNRNRMLLGAGTWFANSCYAEIGNSYKKVWRKVCPYSGWSLHNSVFLFE